MEIQQIIEVIEKLAPPALQENYDNAGLLVGDKNGKVNKALICLDVTEKVIDEAISLNAGLIISHHPLIFQGLKKISQSDLIGKMVIKAIKNDIAIYAVHTNLDNVDSGVNKQICEKLDLKNCRILKPKPGLLKKLVTFCPDIKLADGSYVPDVVRKALFDAGGGWIGNYDCCSYNVEGIGTFRGLENTNQYIGKQFEITDQKEIRMEIIFPAFMQQKMITALLESHPYEEVAYDIYSLDNCHPGYGAGMVGDLTFEMDENKFLELVKERLEVVFLRHSTLKGKKINRVAVCGGAGSFLIPDALSVKANVFITADLKYHDFFAAESGILLVDAGHFETEQFTINLLYEYLTKYFPNFAFQKISFKTNPINYL